MASAPVFASPPSRSDAENDARRPVGAGCLDREPLAEPAGGAHRHVVLFDGLAGLDQLDHDARPRTRGTDGAADHDVIEQPDLPHPSREHGADLDRHGFARRVAEHRDVGVGSLGLDLGRERTGRVGRG